MVGVLGLPGLDGAAGGPGEKRLAKRRVKEDSRPLGADHQLERVVVGFRADVEPARAGPVRRTTYSNRAAPGRRAAAPTAGWLRRQASGAEDPSAMTR